MPEVTEQQKRSWLEKCSRTDVNGWIWVRIQGAPFERGFQYGVLTAKEYAEAVRVYAAMTMETTGKELAFFRDKAVELQKDKIYPELLEEMEGLARAIRIRGCPRAWMTLSVGTHGKR